MNEAHDVQHVRSDGLEIAVKTVGQGRPLIWAHGLSGWRRSALVKFSHLADQYQVIAFDQRGHADSSPVTDPALYDPMRMAGDIAAVLDTLGHERAIVGGESMGAASALTFAMKWPERVEALLLLSPAFGDRPNTQANVIKTNGRLILDDGIEAYLAKTAREQRVMGMPEDLIAYLEEVRRKHRPASLATAMLTVIDWILFDDLSELAWLDVSVCIGAWPNDPLHPMELAKRMMTVLPNAEMKIIPSMMEFFLNPAGLGDLCHRFVQSTIDER